MGPRNAQLNYNSGSDNFTFNVRVDRWGEEKRAYVSVELQEESSGLSFGNGEYFEIKVGDQPIGFDVRYASSTEAELGYWLMAEQKTVSDGDFQIDGVTVWSKSGNTITFDNGTSVWDPQKMQSVTSADISSGQHFNFDITITSSSTTYMVWIDIVSGSPVVGYEKMQFVAPTGGFGGDMGGGGMGGGPLFTMWVPKGEYICSDGFGGFWNMPSACDGQAVTLLYLNPTGTLDLGSSFTISQNDNKPDESGGSYAFDNSSSPAKRTLSNSQWQDAFYRFKTSGGQSFDVRTFSADYWDEGSGDAFQGMSLEILPGADQFSGHTGGGHAGGGHTDGGYNDGVGSQTGGTPSIWAKGSCSQLRCVYKEETHSDPQGGSVTSYKSNLSASQTSWVSVNVEKGPPPDLNQNYTSWGGIPDHMGCTTKTIDFAASVNVGGARSQVIWGENCSMTGGGATYSGVVIALIEQDHYVTVFASGVTTKSELASDTSLTGILSGITWVSSKPADENL